MKFTKIYNRLILMTLAVLAISFTACSNDDDDSSASVLLEAFGPSPALRGSQLSFIGKNMDKVTKVILPDNIEITDIEVISGEKIRITIPQDAAVGYVKLITPNGEITSKTLLTYTEPISISSIAPSPVKAGQTLTIEGDYLNLIQEVIFAKDVVVTYEDFITWERSKIEVVVPREAQTGTIILADTAAIPVELESEIELQVILPSVDQVVDLTNKKPGDLITITGKDLDLVEQMILPNGASGISVDFKVEDNKLSFNLQEGVTDGVVVMAPASEVHVTIANIGMAIPTSLVATPATDIKSGTVITITGIDMDLVTSVTFPGVDEPVTPSSQSATEIKITTPEGATSGNLSLNTASGNTATIAIVTLKPAVTSYSPASVPAGENVTLNGTNLDLVAKVKFGGNKEVEVTQGSPTALTVAVPIDAETGALTLVMKNGETIECPPLTVTKPEFCYIPVLPGEDEEIKSGTILAIEVQNGDKLTAVQVNGNNVQYILQGSTLNISIPANANGNTNIKLISSNGDVTYTIYVINSAIIETTIFTGPLDITWNDGGRVMLPISYFENLRAETILKIYFTQHPAWGQIQLNEGSWGGLTFSEIAGAYITTDVLGNKSITEIELRLTQDILNTIKAKANEGNGMIIQGQDFTIDRISLITGR
jgi:hypothetical protein